MKIVQRVALILCFLLSASYLTAQEGPQTLQEQFDSMLKRSNRYQDYKVGKIVQLNQFHQNVQDSLDQFRAVAITDKTELATRQQTIDSLKTAKSNLETALSESQAKEEGISIFGSLMKKSSYKTMVWIIIGLLLLGLIGLFMGYRNRASVTRALSMKLSEVETEFEEHRQRALEREQQIRRKLQDEINKNKTDS